MVIRYASQLPHRVARLRDGRWDEASDALAIEEPLEIRVSWREGGKVRKEPITITMRTPGRDLELAAGFLYGEGIIEQADDIAEIGYCQDVETEAELSNTVLVQLRRGLTLDLEGKRRNFTTTSACGVCGKASLEALAENGCSVLPVATTMRADVLLGLPDALRTGQRGFDATGGVHASGLFSRDGALLSLQEDVGRHNAFDKLVGEQLLAGRLERFADLAVLLSGRASYELLQKALRARVPIVAAVGAPSSLAVAMAEEYGVTLVGFLRAGGFNVYAGRERIYE